MTSNVDVFREGETWHMICIPSFSLTEDVHIWRHTQKLQAFSGGPAFLTLCVGVEIAVGQTGVHLRAEGHLT